MKRDPNPNATFLFLSQEEDPWVTSGTALIRDKEMVLEFFAVDDPRPYVVVGRKFHGTYKGKHQGPDDVDAWAVWMQLDAKTYLGVWLENNIEYLFRVTMT